jgi:ubiquinone biosynthesis O-methyltransferase
MIRSFVESLFDTGERYVSDGPFDKLQATHTITYVLCEQFVENKDVLDAGCGCGYGSEHLAGKGARSVVGVDISKQAIKFARRRYSRDNLQFMVKDCCDLDFNDGSFDFVVSSQVIEHLPCYEKFLADIQRILKPNGVFVVGTVNRKLTSFHGEKLQFSFHVKEVSPEEFHDLLSQYFKEVQMLGQREVCEDKWGEKISRGWRVKFFTRLGTFNLVRAIARLLPLKLRNLAIYGKRQYPHYEYDDYEVSADHIDQSPILIAICKK